MGGMWRGAWAWSRPWCVRVATTKSCRRAGGAFRIQESDHRPVAEPGAPPEVDDVLGGAAPGRSVWRDVEIEGGPDGITARRPGKAHPQGYVYDLWLVERLADRLGA
jgi:hypothetical protein